VQAVAADKLRQQLSGSVAFADETDEQVFVWMMALSQIFRSRGIQENFDNDWTCSSRDMLADKLAGDTFLDLQIPRNSRKCKQACGVTATPALTTSRDRFNTDSRKPRRAKHVVR